MASAFRDPQLIGIDCCRRPFEEECDLCGPVGIGPCKKERDVAGEEDNDAIFRGVGAPAQPAGGTKTTVSLDLVKHRSGKMMTKGQKRWLDFWYDLARFMSSRSKDPRTKVGAVIVGADRRMTALGYNGFPPGVEDSPERLQHRETKYHFIQHAERAVIDNAQFDLAGATLYVTMYPCSECAKSIVAKRIKCVVCPPPPTEEPWEKSARFAAEMFAEAGIEVVEIDHTH